MAQILSGKEVSAFCRAKIASEVAELGAKTGITPGLAVVVVGNDPASAVYVRNKHKACAEVGIFSETFALPEETTEEQLLQLVDRLNQDARFHGILVQLPLPRHIAASRVIEAISPFKDVDAFHPENVGRIVTGEATFLPCTPAGIMAILDYYHISVKGKNCVVVGRSNIVGKPMALLLLAQSGTVTVCHSATVNLAEHTSRADILVSAVGKPGFIRGDMVKENAVVIDVGINRLANGILCGDVAFDEVEKKAAAITPVPGGVGPMTITMLLANTLKAAKKEI